MIRWGSKPPLQSIPPGHTATHQAELVRKRTEACLVGIVFGADEDQQSIAPVVEDAAGNMNGLISERELTAAVARWGSDAPHRKVQDIMVKEPLAVRSTDTLNVVTTAMTHLRARHALVIDEDKLVGILSIGDVLKFRLDEKIQENLVLQDIARWRTAA